MRAAPIPENDAHRLQVLRDLLILDTPPEDRFDNIVFFAMQEFEVPIATISLVDENRQWFKAQRGLNCSQTSRDISFCGHAIHRPEILMIEDARLDERFATNPLVTGDPFIRFYAGAPLLMEGGHAIGTLCLIDIKPRVLDAVELAILRSLRDLVVGEIQAGNSPR